MEYSDFVTDVIALERQAREITREARERAAAFDSDVTQKIDRLRADYSSRAEQRLAKVKQVEAAIADDAIATQDRQFAEAMRRVESAYEKNHEDWAMQLFSKIIGTTQ